MTRTVTGDRSAEIRRAPAAGLSVRAGGRAATLPTGSSYQAWRVVPALANAGLSIWGFLYLVAARPETPFEVMPVLLPMLVMIAGLAFGNRVSGLLRDTEVSALSTPCAIDPPRSAQWPVSSPFPLAST